MVTTVLTEHLHAADWFDFQDPESGVRGDSVCLHCVIVLNDQLIIMKQEVVHSCWISICIFSDQSSGCDFPVQPHTSCWSARTFAPPSGGTREASTAYNANFPTCISWYKAPTPFKLSPLPGETNLSAGMAINVAYTSGTTDNLSRSSFGITICQFVTTVNITCGEHQKSAEIAQAWHACMGEWLPWFPLL